MVNKKEEKLNESVVSQLAEIVNSSLGKDSGITNNTNDAEKLETIKIILASILMEKHLESLTNLNDSQIDDINDAFYLYEYFDNPIILNFIEHRLKLSRSIIQNQPKNLLTILSELAGKTGLEFNGLSGENKGVLGRWKH